MQPVLTALFVPGSRPDRFAKASASHADAMILDLEDAVAPGEKQSARDAVETWLLSSTQSATQVWIRINSPGSPHFAADAALLVSLQVHDRLPSAVLVPKAESAESLEELAALLPADLEIVALIESAAGVLAAPSLATHRRVARLAFGAADFSADVGCTTTETSLLHARSVLVVASAAAGIEPPLDSPCFSTGDAPSIERHARHGRELGFEGSLCIHPFQIQHIRSGYAPTAREAEWARQVLDRGGDGGAVRVGDEMVDAPVLERARRIISTFEDRRDSHATPE